MAFYELPERGDGDVDVRTTHFLEAQLNGTNMTPYAIEDISSRVVLKEVMKDEVEMLQNELNILKQRSMNGRSQPRSKGKFGKRSLTERFFYSEILNNLSKTRKRVLHLIEI